MAWGVGGGEQQGEVAEVALKGATYFVGQPGNRTLKTQTSFMNRSSNGVRHRKRTAERLLPVFVIVVVGGGGGAYFALFLNKVLENLAP